jgi:hypothetical protein
MLENGTIVVGYRIDGVLGEGGMGTVYRATQLSLNRTVALKLLSPELSKDAGFRERFRREGQLQAAIEHIHIVTVYEAGDAESEGLFIAMRLIEGVTLKNLILRGELDVRRALRLLTQVAGALDAAHERGLTHRDIKPQNILIGQRDHAYLADFGLTKASDDSGLTESGRFIGTIDYVSPEQARGEGATAKSDIYALTGVLCECLSGQVPYPRANEPAVLYAHLIDPPPKLSERRSDLPAAIDEVIERGLAKDPDDRPDSATQLMLEARRAFALPGAPDELGTAPREFDDSGPTRLHSAQESHTVAARTQPAGGSETRLAAVASAPPVPPPTDRVVAPPGPATDVAAELPAAAISPPRRRRALVATIGVLALAAAALGVVLGAAAQPSAPPLLGSSSAGDLALAFPASWQRSAGAPQIPGLSIASPIVLAPRAAPDSQLEAGMVTADDTQLLPAGLIASLAQPLPAGQPVLLGKLEAERYVGLAPRGLGRRLTAVYVVPTTAGVATIACLAGARAFQTFSADCARIAATLELTGATAYPLGPSPAYASALTRVFATLDAARAGPAAKLLGAATPSAQAQAASALAHAYAAAGRELGGLTVSPAIAGANAVIAADLATLSGAYARAAAAARGGNAAGYAAASSAVVAGAADLVGRLKGLSALGYAPGR